MNGYAEYLLTHIPSAKLVSGGREIVCRCFVCGDSARNPKSRHMYISIPQNDKEISLFYCQRAVCKASGIMTQQVLLEWGLYDPDIAVNLTKHNAAAMNRPENRKYRGTEIYQIYNDTISDDKLSLYKLKYINDRLGSNLSLKDCLDLKIVLNLKDLLARNKLEPTRDGRIIDALDSGFLGFLSYDNAFVNLRNLDLVKSLHPSIDSKYINYNIFGKYDNTKRFYTIPTNIDLRNINPVRLHLAEGSFDILSIYLNLYGGKSDNDIFTSIGGSGYLGIVRYFITTIRIPNMEIHVYLDNDIDRYKIINDMNTLSPFKYPVYLHRNTYPGEKDFGVPVDRIIDSIERVI